jgi:hypothetical protein
MTKDRRRLDELKPGPIRHGELPPAPARSSVVGYFELFRFRGWHYNLCRIRSALRIIGSLAAEIADHALGRE